jgi:hypothetical protein
VREGVDWVTKWHFSFIVHVQRCCQLLRHTDLYLIRSVRVTIIDFHDVIRNVWSDLFEEPGELMNCRELLPKYDESFTFSEARQHTKNSFVLFVVCVIQILSRDQAGALGVTTLSAVGRRSNTTNSKISSCFSTCSLRLVRGLDRIDTVPCMQQRNTAQDIVLGSATSATTTTTTTTTTSSRDVSFPIPIRHSTKPKAIN